VALANGIREYDFVTRSIRVPEVSFISERENSGACRVTDTVSLDQLWPCARSFARVQQSHSNSGGGKH
jgi:hypothetical protein